MSVKGGKRTRVLFVVEAVTLAHVARSRMLAGMLDPSAYDVLFACDRRFEFLFADDGIAQRAIESIASADFAAALASGRPIYDAETLARYVEEDLQVIGRFDPHVIVGDFRLSLQISARVADRPYVNVTNAGWSPYASPRFPVPEIGLTRFVGARVGQILFDLARPVAFARHAAPLDVVRRRHGLSRPIRDLRQAYTEADEVLYADVPELILLDDAPSHHRFLGPVAWSPALPRPPWSGAVPTDRPLVYVNLGSSGASALTPVIVRALEGLPVTTVAAGSDVSPRRMEGPSSTFVAPYLDGSHWSNLASLVICNGGSPTSYQALAAGVPVLGLPSNLDQYCNMAAVERCGAGRLLRSGGANVKTIRRAVGETLEDASLRSGARRMRAAIERCDASSTLHRALHSAIDLKSAPKRSDRVIR